MEKKKKKKKKWREEFSFRRMPPPMIPTVATMEGVSGGFGKGDVLMRFHAGFA